MSGAQVSARLKEPEVSQRSEPTKVLIIGGDEAILESRPILDSLALLGFDLDLIGIAYTGEGDPKALCACDVPVYRDYADVIANRELDLVLMTADDHELRKKLIGLISPQTHIIDSFSVGVLKKLENLSGRLGTCQEKLESVELIKEVLMQGSEVSIMVVDEDFKVLDINNAILRRTKMLREGCLGRSCHWVIHRSIDPCHVKGESCVVLEVLRTGKSTHNVREEKRADGSYRYFTRSAYPLKENELGKRSVLIVWKDVTGGMGSVLDKQARNIKQNFSYFLQQDKMMALGKLAAAAVHEINNPIQGILTFSKLMRSGLEGETLAPDQLPKFRVYLDLISDEAARCGHILRNLLSFARQGELRKSWFDLKLLLDEIFLLVRNRITLQNISLCWEVAPDVPLAYGDRNQIKQAILNLILNAVDAMPGGGIISLVVEFDPDAENIRISVSDTGPGVPKEIQGSIFEPFVTTKQVGKGVGLGLSVVYGIVTQHSGTIQLESEDGKGATFIMTLPAVKRTREENGC
jgi:signal transduction histidine kinase